MADDKPEEKPDDNKPPAAAVEKIETKIESVAEEIANTPKEDQDKEWRESLTSELSGIKAALTALTAQKGASAELAALQQQVKQLGEEITALRTTSATPPVILAPPKSAEEEPLSQETKTETSLETPPAPEAKPERKNRRGWV